MWIFPPYLSDGGSFGGVGRIFMNTTMLVHVTDLVLAGLQYCAKGLQRTGSEENCCSEAPSHKQEDLINHSEVG